MDSEHGGIKMPVHIEIDKADVKIDVSDRVFRLIKFTINDMKNIINKSLGMVNDKIDTLTAEIKNIKSGEK